MPAAMFRTDFTRQTAASASAGRAAMRLVSSPRAADRQLGERQPCETDAANRQFSFGFAEPPGARLQMARPRPGRSRPTLVVTDSPVRQPEPRVDRPSVGVKSPAMKMAGGAALGEMTLRSRADGVDPRFTAWRGQSGRRYVTTAYPLESDEAFSFEDAVLIAISADRSVLAVRDSGPFESLDELQGWRSEVARAGAVEIHVHLIAATPEERRRAVGDLDPGERAAH